MWIFVGLIICGILGAWIGSTKNRGGMGFVLGILLGPIGLIIIAILEKKGE